MTPTSENYTLFMNGENILLHADTPTFNIAVLDHIARYGYPTERLSSEWNYICPYTIMFRDLAEKITLCDDPHMLSALQQQASQRARNILDEVFPQRRQGNGHKHEIDIDTRQTIDMPNKHIHKF